MAKKKKRKTPYQREIENLKRRIKTAEKAGYQFGEQIKIPKSAKKVHELRGNKLYEKATSYISPLGEYQEKPPTVKEKRKIEKEVKQYYREELKQSYYKYGDFRDTPEYEEEKQKQYINKELLIHLYNLLNIFDINNYSEYSGSKLTKKDIRNSERQRDRMIDLLDNTIARDGEDVVAERLNRQTTASEINEMVNEALNTYKKTEQEINADFNAFAQLITNTAFTPIDAQNYSDDYSY